MSIAIRVEGVSKRYTIGAPKAALTLKEKLSNGIDRLRGRRGFERALTDEEAAEQADRPQDFWALRDISFEVMEGERIGIIGANGAGKSTLLKVLSRITAPTTGRVEIHGKVASLLEVGTGFHNELTGRENVFLNGAVLGMTREEVARKFDQIVEFAGTEKFIDTPVKFYSSGMYVRLAFAVSAWLDPDILIVDEVLSVGDQAFQKRSAERIRELTKEGRTVLFVSHSMGLVNQMCQKALYLEHGRVQSFGPVEDETREYTREVIKQIEVSEAEGRGDRWRWHRASFALPDPHIEVMTDHPGAVDCLSGEAASPEGEVTEIIPIERETHLTVRFRVNRDLARPLVLSINVYDEIGQILFVALPETTLPARTGELAVTCVLPPFLLNEGRFTVNANLSDFLADNTVVLAVVAAFRFEIQESKGADRRRHGFEAPLPGAFRTRLEFRPASQERSGPGPDPGLTSSGAAAPAKAARPRSKPRAGRSGTA
jgi:lipopolysaccharide transport system ATP-binding protein